jgi:hypothetical protein
MICEICQKDKSNCSAFRGDNGQQWASVCGGCKFRITLADPKRKARMEADLKQIATAAILGTKGGEG